MVRRGRGREFIGKSSGFNAFRGLLVRARKIRPVRGNRYCLARKGGFVRNRPSVRMRSLVCNSKSTIFQALIQTEQDNRMALKCEFCGKAPAYGNVISH